MNRPKDDFALLNAGMDVTALLHEGRYEEAHVVTVRLSQSLNGALESWVRHTGPRPALRLVGGTRKAASVAALAA